MATKGKDLLQKWGNADPDPQSTDSQAASLETTNPPFPRDILKDTIEDDIESEELQLGGELATLFKDNGIHPIFIFGSKGSGKTSLLASLFRYIQLAVQSEATIHLRDDIFPTEERWRNHASWARDVFYKKVNDSIESTAPAATLEPSPFFVPIRLKRKTGEDISFAFLEGKGEWYMPDESAEVPFKPFKGFLQGILQQFNGSATVIYVAPYTTGGYSRGEVTEGARSNDLRKSDMGLVGAINEYVSLRRAHFHQDNHLFLMTKWDIYCGGVSSDSFYHPPSDDIQLAFRERFELSWTRFQNLESAGSVQKKIYSAYCAGIIDGLSIARPAVEDMEVIDRFPRKVWDWLHQNHTGLPMYEDVQPKRPSLLDRLIQLLRG